MRSKEQSIVKTRIVYSDVNKTDKWSIRYLKYKGFSYDNVIKIWYKHGKQSIDTGLLHYLSREELISIVDAINKGEDVSDIISEKVREIKNSTR